MSFKFQKRPWMGHFSALFGKQNRKGAQPRSRHLRGESLEPRCVLSTLPVDDYLTQVCEPEPAPTESSGFEDPTTQAAPEVDLSFVESAEGDSCGGFAGDPATISEPLASGEGEGDLTNVLNSGLSSEMGGGGEENQAPEITALTMTIEGGFLVIRGSVRDESPASCTITLSGVLSETTTVDDHGDFEFRLASPQLCGLLRFVAIDGDGLESAAWTEWLDPS